MPVIGRRLNERAGLLKNLQPVLLRQLFAKNTNLPAGGLHKPQKHLESRGLPGAIRPQKSVDTAFRHMQIQCVYYFFMVIFFSQCICCDNIVHILQLLSKSIIQRGP